MGDSQKSKRVFWKVCPWLGVLPYFFTKSVKFGFGELSISWICAESRDLQSGHGFRACSLKKKEKIGFSYLGGSQKPKKTKMWNEICQMLVSGALEGTTTIGKAGADIFAKSGPETP